MTKKARKKQRTEYRWSVSKTPRLPMNERILLYLYHRDRDAGRTGKVGDWYSDLKEALFRFSSGFVHATEVVLWNVLFWEEVQEYGHADKRGEGKIELLPMIEAVAIIPAGKRQSFRLALRKLRSGELVYAFCSSVRGIKGMGGRSTLAPEIWSPENRDKLSDISAVSLTEKGFRVAHDLAAKHSILFPWQLHHRIVRDKEFAKFMKRKI